MRPRSWLGWLAVVLVLVLTGLLATVLHWAFGSMASYPPPAQQSVAENDRYDVALAIAIFTGLCLLALGALTTTVLLLLRRTQPVATSAARALNDQG